MKRPALAIVCFLLLSGCIRDPVFDTSSLEAFQASTAAIRVKLSNDDWRRTEIALNYMIAEGVPRFDGQLLQNVAMNSAFTNPYFAIARLGPRINGQSAGAVVSNLRLKLDAEIAEIDSRMKSSQPVLNTVEIGSPRYYWRDSGRKRGPVIEFSVFNGGTLPVTQAYLRFTLTTPNRPVPWVKQDFLQSFQGGLVPRERREVSIDPPYGGPWTNTQLQDLYDSKLQVEVVNFADANGEKTVAVDTRSLDVRRQVRTALQ